MPSTHIFCRVVDNYGDLGVCWRLARQLVAEQDRTVTLWVDDAATVQQMRTPSHTELTGLHWRHWGSDDEWLDRQAVESPIDELIEGFGCRVPEALLAQLSRQNPVPKWINLEYLTAEDWAASCHGLTSPHPRLPMAQRFFFPGFVPTTGGLLRERDLLQRRDQYQQDSHAQQQFWQRMGLPQAESFARRISLFAYRTVAVEALLDHLRAQSQPVLLALTASQHLDVVQRWLRQQGHRAALTPSRPLTLGALTLLPLPFLSHEDFDRLLWSCDLNLIRGEDSLVRAIWAGRPWLWHIYPQQDDAHHDKLAALCTQLRRDLAPDTGSTEVERWCSALTAYGQEKPVPWPEFLPALPALQRLSQQWASQLSAQPDLATQLVQQLE